MRTLAVNEFFVTLQGEASFAGTPAVFVRFQGCPVACPWCDTQYAARLDGATLDFAAVRAKQGPGAGYADVEPGALLAAIREAGPRHVVLTGGDCNIIAKRLNLEEMEVNENLVTIGLNRILEHNESI